MTDRRRFRLSCALASPLVVCLGFVAVVCGQAGQRDAAQPLRASAKALFDAAFAVDRPGGTAIVVKGGQPILRAARGMASLELGVPLEADSVMRIGSVTKQFTSAAIMMLVEQGKVALDDDITKFMPDYPTKGRHITVEHLLTHTSGIRSYTGLPAWQPSWGRDFTPAQLIDFFKNEPTEFEPGEKYAYNNSAYFLLGALIEKVSGVSYGEFVSRSIFVPLGMTRTRYGDTGPILKGRAQGYAQDGPAIINAPYISMTQPGAAGGLVSTVDDLAKWDGAVTAGKLLTAGSWQRIFTPYRLKNGRSTGYGFGWQIGVFEGHAVQEHGGGIHGFSAYVIRLPEDHAYVAVLSNLGNTNTGGLARKLAALAVGKPLVDPQAIAVDPKALTAYAGTYVFDDGMKVLVTAGDSLVVQPPPPAPVSALVPMAPDAFFVRDSFSRFTFERDPAGNVVSMTRKTWGSVDRGKKIE